MLDIFKWFRREVTERGPGVDYPLFGYVTDGRYSNSPKFVHEIGIMFYAGGSADTIDVTETIQIENMIPQDTFEEFEFCPKCGKKVDGILTKAS